MNILIVGSGGREHAIASTFLRSPLVKKIVVSPGNPGIEEIAELFSELIKRLFFISLDFVTPLPTIYGSISLYFCKFLIISIKYFLFFCDCLSCLQSYF